MVKLSLITDEGDDEGGVSSRAPARIESRVSSRGGNKKDSRSSRGVGGAGPLTAPIVSTSGALAAATDQPRFNGAWSQEKEDSVEVIYLRLKIIKTRLKSSLRASPRYAQMVSPLRLTSSTPAGRTHTLDPTPDVPRS